MCASHRPDTPPPSPEPPEELRASSPSLHPVFTLEEELRELWVTGLAVAVTLATGRSLRRWLLQREDICPAIAGSGGRLERSGRAQRYYSRSIAAARGRWPDRAGDSCHRAGYGGTGGRYMYMQGWIWPENMHNAASSFKETSLLQAQNLPHATQSQ